MTWVLATAGLAFGTMVGDVRVSRMINGVLEPYRSAGLRKIDVFSDQTACGFAGRVDRAWKAVDSVHAFMIANGYDDPPIIEQLEAWIADLEKRGDELVVSDEYRTELLLLRARFGTTEDGTVLPILSVAGVRVVLPHRAAPSFTLQPFSGVDHIGSGSDIPAYQAAAEETNQSLFDFAGVAVGAARADFMGRIYAEKLSNIVMASREVSVSPEITALVLGPEGASGGTFHRSDPPLRVCLTLDEFRRWAAAEDHGAPLAVIA